MSTKIFHNPRCSTSRTVLALLREAGQTPEVVAYLDVGWTQPQLEDLLTRMGATARDILRAKEPIAQTLNLAEADDATILTAMLDHPILVERPIVVTAKGAVVCRPAERLWEVVERA